MSKKGILVTISRESTQLDYPYDLAGTGSGLIKAIGLLKERGFSTYFNEDDPLLAKWIHWADDENYSGDLSEIEDLVPLYFNEHDKDTAEQYMLENNITHTIEHADDTFDLTDFIKVPQV